MINLKPLKLIREAKKIPQKLLADAIGVDATTYSRIENGIIPLKAKDIPIIAKVLGIPTMDIAEAIFFQNDVA